MYSFCPCHVPLITGKLCLCSSPCTQSAVGLDHVTGRIDEATAHCEFEQIPSAFDSTAFSLKRGRQISIQPRQLHLDLSRQRCSPTGYTVKAEALLLHSWRPLCDASLGFAGFRKFQYVQQSILFLGRVFMKLTTLL